MILVLKSDIEFYFIRDYIKLITKNTIIHYRYHLIINDRHR